MSIEGVYPLFILLFVSVIDKIVNSFFNLNDEGNMAIILILILGIYLGYVFARWVDTSEKEGIDRFSSANDKLAEDIIDAVRKRRR